MKIRVLWGEMTCSPVDCMTTSTLKIEAAEVSETVVTIYQTKWRNISEDKTVYSTLM
jgi:hypothetical protein